MLAGTVYFYDSYKNIRLEMDIEDYNMSNEELFAKILELNVSKVVVKGISHSDQMKETVSIIFSERY